MGSRRKAREFSLQILYQLDLNPQAIGDAFAAFWESERADTEIRKFCEVLVSGTWEKKEVIDLMIQPILKNWKIDRLTLIDRNILRLGTFEMVFLPQDGPAHEKIPFAVTINEAVEIAKKYSDPESGKFVNGILDQIRKDSGLKESHGP